MAAQAATLMVDQILTAAVGLISTLLGVLVGWYLSEVSRARKERTDSYRKALDDVGQILEHALKSIRGKEYFSHREVHLRYLLALGRLEPYIKRVGEERFQELRDAFTGEMFSDTPNILIGRAIDTINQLLSEDES